MDWGFSQGNLDDVPHITGNRLQEQYLSTVAQILPANRWMRWGIKVDSAGLSLPFDQARNGHDYDQLFYMTAKYGFKNVINLHVGSAPYAKPPRDGGGAMTTFYNWIKSMCDRYCGTSATFDNGSTASVYGVNQTVSGHTKPVRFEIWNEPNSPTGNANDTSGSTGGMTAADCYDILYYASKALREHGFAHGWTPYVIGLGLANTEGGITGYWTTIVNYGAGAGGKTYTVNSVTYGPNPHDFIDALGIHPYSSADPATSAGSGSPIRTTIGNIRTYCDAHGGSAKDFYITEWGWRGHNLANKYTLPAGNANCLWEDTASEGAGQGSQEQWESDGMATIQAVTAWKITGAHHYGIPDDNTGSDVQNLGVTYNALAGTAIGPIPTGSWKAVATKIQTMAAGAAPLPVDPTASILRRGQGIRITQ